MSIELNGSNKVYTSLSTGQKPYVVSYPVVFIPSPSEQDYKSGKIIRYFCKKVGGENSNIIEVNSMSFDTIKSNSIPLYAAVKVNWKISGPRNTLQVNNIIQSIGVEEFNLKSINDSENIFSGIKSLLSNKLLQFWRGF